MKNRELLNVDDLNNFIQTELKIKYGFEMPKIKVDLLNDFSFRIYFREDKSILVTFPLIYNLVKFPIKHPKYKENGFYVYDKFIALIFKEIDNNIRYYYKID